MKSKPTLQDAIELATKHHKGQVDKGGKPYIKHPIRVMKNLTLADEKIVAVLHDIVEDTSVTLEYLKELGYNSYIIHSIDCLTKRDSESNEDYIKRVMSDTMASRVKLSDLEDNMDTSRLKEITEKDKKRLKKYKNTHSKITDHLSPERRCKICGDVIIFCKCYEGVIKDIEGK